MMFDESCGLTATKGSSSLFTQLISPGNMNAETSHEANGLELDAWLTEVVAYRPAEAAATGRKIISAQTPAAVRGKEFVMPHLHRIKPKSPAAHPPATRVPLSIKDATAYTDSAARAACPPQRPLEEPPDRVGVTATFSRQAASSASNAAHCSSRLKGRGCGSGGSRGGSEGGGGTLTPARVTRRKRDSSETLAEGTSRTASACRACRRSCR